MLPPTDPEREAPSHVLRTFHELAKCFGYELGEGLLYATRTWAR
ncbi:MAG: hypothetical protein R6X02_12065 [Enhygromyxa sp.]